MTRTKRDYCSKGRHPRWRLWRAEYGSGWKMPRLGVYCTECGGAVADNVGRSPYLKRILP
jgi:hypothetical protein